MQQSLSEIISKVSFLTGDENVVKHISDVPVKQPFDASVLSFLDDVSRILMSDREVRQYSDVVTFAFWIRKSSIMKMKEKYLKDDKNVRLGKGMIFHIAPSNVPVNFAYSLVAGLLTGNTNIVKVPARKFPQIAMITEAMNHVLEKRKDMEPYLVLIRYGHEQDVNDWLSSMTDVRVVWGGDATVAKLRRSVLPPRSTEITFADRYSLAVIDSDCYMAREDKEAIAEGFYNDTYFTDQNACTSPRIIVWTGEQIDEAKDVFWDMLHSVVDRKYQLQPIQSINKLTSSYMAAVLMPGCRIRKHNDNLIVRVQVPQITDFLMDMKDNSGYFFEYDSKDIMDIRGLCNDKHCQTIAYIGNKNVFLPLVMSGIKGIDRIVPIGKTMDFDLIWDGYNLTEEMTRIISV